MGLLSEERWKNETNQFWKEFSEYHAATFLALQTYSKKSKFSKEKEATKSLFSMPASQRSSAFQFRLLSIRKKLSLMQLCLLLVIVVVIAQFSLQLCLSLVIVVVIAQFSLQLCLLLVRVVVSAQFRGPSLERIPLHLMHRSPSFLTLLRSSRRREYHLINCS